MSHRTWLITGVNSGFGRLMTESLLERGDRVAGTVRKMDTMNDLKAKYGDLLSLEHLDMTDLSGIRRVVDKAFGELGRIDVIVSKRRLRPLWGSGRTQRRTSRASALHKPVRANPVGTYRVASFAGAGGGCIIGLSTYGGQAALRAVPCIMPPNGAWKAFSMRLRRSSRRSRSA